jgi:hypothetical protein
MYNLNNNKSHFYHEGQAKRGPKEICSLLLDYITNHISSAVKELNIFSRQLSWPKQNHSVVRFFEKLSANGRCIKFFNIFLPEGTLYYPVTGTLDLFKKFYTK